MVTSVSLAFNICRHPVLNRLRYPPVRPLLFLIIDLSMQGMNRDCDITRNGKSIHGGNHS